MSWHFGLIAMRCALSSTKIKFHSLLSWSVRFYQLHSTKLFQSHSTIKAWTTSSQNGLTVEQLDPQTKQWFESQVYNQKFGGMQTMQFMFFRFTCRYLLLPYPDFRVSWVVLITLNVIWINIPMSVVFFSQQSNTGGGTLWQERMIELIFPTFILGFHRCYTRDFLCIEINRFTHL